MNGRISLESLTADQLSALYDSFESTVEELQNLRRVYEWSVERWGVERKRLTADIEWMRASAPPEELVSQLCEATTEMGRSDPGSPELEAWEHRWADHFTAMGFRLKKAEEALGCSVPGSSVPS